MTTTTAPEQEQARAKVDLTAANGAAPKRRGRPPGSKNKPKEGTTRRTRRPAATPTTTMTAAPAKTAKTVDITAHAVLIENGSVNVLLSDGSSFKIDGPVFDRR